MNHLSIEYELSTRNISIIINKFLDSKRTIANHDLDALEHYFRQQDYKKLRERCYSISGSISTSYGSRDYLTNCIHTKIDDKDAIQITIPISKEVWTKIVLYPVGVKGWKIDINNPIEADKIFGQILAFLAFEQELGKEKIRLDYKESTVGIGLATLSMLVSNNISEAKILEDLGQDLYHD